MTKRLALLARFDTAVLQPPPADVPWPPAAGERFEALRNWCLLGAVPKMTQPLTITRLHGDAHRVRELALQLCLERDGSLQMQALGATGRIGLRLKTKLNELLPARALRASDPWDAGSLIASAEGLKALAQFRPRRPTVMVVDHLDAATLSTVLTTLSAQQADYAWPLRVLVLGEAA